MGEPLFTFVLFGRNNGVQTSNVFSNRNTSIPPARVLARELAVWFGSVPASIPVIIVVFAVWIFFALRIAQRLDRRLKTFGETASFLIFASGSVLLLILLFKA